MAGSIDILEEVRKLEEIIPFEITPGTADDIEKGRYDGNLMKYIQPWLDAAGAELEKGAKGTVIVPAGRYVLMPVDEPGLQIPYLRLPPNVHLLMEGVFVFGAADDVPILVVGEDDKANHCVELRMAVERCEDYKSDWSSEDNIGIKLINCYSCDINIMRASFNTIGVQCIGMDAHHRINSVGPSGLHPAPQRPGVQTRGT